MNVLRSGMGNVDVHVVLNGEMQLIRKEICQIEVHLLEAVVIGVVRPLELW